MMARIAFEQVLSTMGFISYWVTNWAVPGDDTWDIASFAKDEKDYFDILYTESFNYIRGNYVTCTGQYDEFTQ